MELQGFISDLGIYGSGLRVKGYMDLGFSDAGF